MAIWFAIKAVLLIAAPQVLDFMGRASDLISDASPEFLHSIEHVVFTAILN